MRKLITFLFVTTCMLVMLPSVSHSGVFTDPHAFDPDCSDESHLSPLYNATVTSAKFLGQDGTSEYFLLKLQGCNVHVLEGRKSHLRVFAKACDECTMPDGKPFRIGTLEGGSQLMNGEVFSINVNSADKTADNFADIGIKLPLEMVQGETTIMMEFNYCDDSAPWEGNYIKLCELFADKRSRCPMPELPAPPDPNNPFLGAQTEIVIAPEMTITTGGAQFTTPDENHVFMQINITGNMMHVLDEEDLNYITVWKVYGNMTSTNFSKQVELIDNGNNVFTLRITVPGLLKNEFSQTHFKIEYEKPPQEAYDYNVQKMCTLITGEPNLPPFCTQIQFVPIPAQMAPPATPPDE